MAREGLGDKAGSAGIGGGLVAVPLDDELKRHIRGRIRGAHKMISTLGRLLGQAMSARAAGARRRRPATATSGSWSSW